MSHNRILCRVAAVFVVGWFAMAQSGAQTVDRRVFFTFSGPVDMPGVGLAPGKYIFHLVDPNTPYVVQVVSADGKTPYGMFFTRPVERSQPAAKPEVRFMETPAGAPPAIKSYWMSGERTGWEFIYPKEQAMRLAKSAKEPVLTTQAQTTKTEETNTTALSRVSSDGSETKVASNAPTATSTVSGSNQEGEAAPASIVIAVVKIPPPTRP